VNDKAIFNNFQEFNGK